MGAHHPRHAAPELETARTPLVAWLVIVPIAVLTIAAMVWLWPADDAEPARQQSSA